jgi:ERF superfamily protein
MSEQSTQLTVKTNATPSELLSQAIDKGLTVEALEKLMDLNERWEKNEARKLFFGAFTEFQANCPDMRKTKGVEFNGKLQYKYAPLADITRQIGPVLKKNELSYRWEIKDDGKSLSVTCLVSHVAGHTETTTMTADADTSGSKNAIQARGSAIEYLKRYTLTGALGISTADSDIDGRLPDVDIDRLHKEFMDLYNQAIQLDSTMTKYHTDNWKGEPTAKAYVAAIGEMRKQLFTLQQKAK